jgi:hypothetical protein
VDQQVELLAAPDVPVDAVLDLAAALDAIGCPATARALPRHRGGAELSWMLVVAVPAASFFRAFAEQLGKDSAGGLAGMLKPLFHRRDGSTDNRSVLVESTNSDTRIVIEATTPAAAVDRMVRNAGDWSGGPWRYHQETGEWRVVPGYD